MKAGPLRAAWFLAVRKKKCQSKEEHMRIGELLVMNGLITEEQLDQALQEQARHPKKLGEILSELGFITERQLVEALEFQLGIPVLNINETVFDIRAVQLIPESIARKHKLVPFDCSGGKIKVAMSDPANNEAIKEIQMASGMSVQPFIAIRTEVEEAVIRYYGGEEAAMVLNGIIQAGVYQKASGVHFEPHETGLIVKYRIGSTLKTQKIIPKPIHGKLIERIKYVSHLNAAEGKIPQNGRFQMQVDHVQLDIRVSTLPALNGEFVFLQLMDESEALLAVSELDFSEANLQKYENAIQRASGMILVSGPTNSGKTTLLYSTLQHLKDENLKIITVEDPIMRRMSGITQMEVNEQSGPTFTNGLRSVLQHDPNIIMIGEMRNAESVDIAIRTTLSGRLVFGSIYGLSAVKTLDRLLGMGVDAHLLGSSLSCVVAQRLVRRVCRQCAQSVPITDEETKLFEAHGALQAEDQKNGKGLIGNFRSLVSAQISGKITVTQANGCRLCNETGYRGVIPLQEVILIDEPLRGLIIQRRPIQEIEKHLEQTGFKTLLHDGLIKVRDGMTTVEEVWRAVI
jgi:type IV pilus assembly protein PilB